MLLLAASLGWALEPRPGRLLVAARELRDPNFAETVVLLVAANQEGALGLILNRPSDVPVRKVIPQAPAGVYLFAGGPVEIYRIFALERGPGIDQVIRGLSFLSNQRAIEKSLLAAADRIRVFAGYSGWGPGQLEREIAQGAWKVLPASLELAFPSEPETLWHQLIRRTEVLTAHAHPQ